MFIDKNDNAISNNKRNFEVVIDVIKYLIQLCDQEPFLNVISIILYYYSEKVLMLKSICLENEDYCKVF